MILEMLNWGFSILWALVLIVTAGCSISAAVSLTRIARRLGELVEKHDLKREPEEMKQKQ